ncbi:MFS transporter [Nonomuraea sp. NPDC049141]|uniref:MFS transporter n=1 Tax=Nonomuraea sp. NPDC049141 TaxID=3155500 RepID=UPI0034101AE1
MPRAFPPYIAFGSAALTISVAGDELLHYVFLVHAVHGSHPLSLGLLGFLIALPPLFGGAVGGWLDRHRAHNHHVLLGAFAGSAACCFALWASWTSEHAATAAYVSAFALGMLSLAIAIIWQARVSQIVPPDRPELVGRVLSWTSTLMSVGLAVGPVLASILVGAWGHRTLILFDALSFAAGLALMIPIARRLKATGRDGASRPPARLSRSMGLGMVLRAPLVRSPALALAIMNFLAVAVMFAVPLLVVERGLPLDRIAWASSAGILATLAGSVLGTYARRGHWLLVSVVLEPALRSAGLLVLALSGTTSGLLAGIALFYLPQGMARIARMSYLEASFEPEAKATAVGAYRMLIRGLMPVGPLVMAPAVAFAGARPFLLAGVLLLVALSFWLLGDGALRRSAHRYVLSMSKEQV